MPTLAQIERARGRRLDDVVPEVVDRFRRAPHVSPNPYIGHRLTIETGDGRCRCDCGAGPYSTATELEAHQSPYRHPVPMWARR